MNPSSYWTYWKKNLPTYLTYSRIAAAPLFFFFFYRGEERWPLSGLIVAIIFTLASITDWLDGWWARHYQVTSKSGALMDTVADKVLVLSVLLILLEMKRIPSEMVAIFLTRDILMGGLRSLGATEGFIISAKSFGKLKTGFQMIAIPCLFIYESFPIPYLYQIGYYLLWLSVILSLISAYGYIKSYLSFSLK